MPKTNWPSVIRDSIFLIFILAVVIAPFGTFTANDASELLHVKFNTTQSGWSQSEQFDQINRSDVGVLMYNFGIVAAEALTVMTYVAYAVFRRGQSLAHVISAIALSYVAFILVESYLASRFIDFPSEIALILLLVLLAANWMIFNKPTETVRSKKSKRY